MEREKWKYIMLDMLEKLLKKKDEETNNRENKRCEKKKGEKEEMEWKENGREERILQALQ